MGKYALPLGITLSALIFLGFLAYDLLEIYDRKRPLPPSREAQANEYLALDRWLTGAGYPVRVESRGHPHLITEAPEPVIFIQASLFYWPGDAWEQLEPWIAAGGSLIISLDIPWYERQVEGLNSLLAALNISSEDQITAEHPFYPRSSEPNFDPLVAFSLPELSAESPENFSGEFDIITDRRGIIRLVRVRWGAGMLTVLGKAPFLTSGHLDREPNALLAWELLAPRQEKTDQNGHPGILFIRGKREVQQLFGRLADRGSFPPLIISVLALIAVGFWTVIPRFGIPAREDEKPGRPLRERFLAESRFLQKYRALDTYRTAYVQEILRRLRLKEDPGDEAALDRRFSELWEAAAPKGAGIPRAGSWPGRRSFVKTVETLQTILERL